MLVALALVSMCLQVAGSTRTCLFMSTAHTQGGLPDWKGLVPARAWAERADHVTDVAWLVLRGCVPDRVRMVTFVEALAANLPEDFQGRGQLLDKLRLIRWAEQGGGPVTRLEDLPGAAKLEVLQLTGATTHEEFLRSDWYRDTSIEDPVTPAACALSAYGTRGGKQRKDGVGPAMWW
jgi:hypothetical protein